MAAVLDVEQVTATYIAQTSLFKTLYVFPAEKNIMARERAKDSYDVAPFFLSKLVAELPVVCGFPVLFGAVMYPMTGLQLSVGRVARALLMVTLDSVTAASLGMAVRHPNLSPALAPDCGSELLVKHGYLCESHLLKHGTHVPCARARERTGNVGVHTYTHR